MGRILHETFRTLLFVPGSKPNWFDKIKNYGADAIILDLEDSVPYAKSKIARGDVARAIRDLDQQGQKVFVRINKGIHAFDLADLEAVIQRELTGLVLPKVNGPEDIDQISELISEIEVKQGIEVGSVKLIPILETARSMYLAYEIGLKKRVIGITGLSAKDGDVSCALGYQWTPEGLETLYLKSKVVLAARAANVMPIGGLWQDVHNLEGLKESASFNRQLGFDGELVLHPSNVPLVNNIYTPSEEEIIYYQGMVEMFEKAEKDGIGAVIYKGEHIDYAHVKTAKQVLALGK